MQGTATRNALNNPRISNLVRLFKSGGNPAALLNGNPQLAGIMSAMSGKDPQKVFYDECKRQNINPDDILNILK